VNDRAADRLCLITGATSGIGRATAQQLAADGATTVLVARDATKGEATAREITEATGNDRLQVLVADLSSQASIRALVEAFRGDHDRLDVLINCASAFFRKRHLAADGLEMTFALNHLAYFLLTNLLLDQLRRSRSGRILNVSAPATTKIDFDDLQAERRYRPLTVFGASKVAELMFTIELAHRLEGTGITVNAVHPGLVRSNLMREAPAPFRFILRLRSQSPDDAGRAIAALATSAEYSGKTGRFYRDGKEIELPTAATSEELRSRLWEMSEELTGWNAERPDRDGPLRSC
jgi:NAD(P)-dependent dehydrogenase (short-subunit alcohol dehydrogenase family)